MKDFKILSKDMEKLVVLVFSIVFGIVLLPHTLVLAEQIGDSPESGVDSRLHTLNDTLSSSSHGSVSSGTWGDWGSMWNRIYSAGIWPSSGDATAADVTAGKTFYAGLTRTLLTGTAVAPEVIDYSYDSLVEWDDGKGISSPGDPVWILTAGSATTGVYKDNRTGLYWSAGTGTSPTGNVFPDTTHSTCDFFTNRVTYTGGDADCGEAINRCGALSLEAVTGGGAKTDWYLPSLKELQQAYIDGAYNKTNTTWTGTVFFWSSTEKSTSASSAWYVYLYNGYTNNYAKTNTGGTVRCVRRD